MATAGQRRAPAPSVAADSTAQAAMPTRWPASAPMLSPSERTSDLSSGSSSSPPARLAARVITGPPSGRNATSVPLNADRSYAASARTAARDAAGSLPDCTRRVRALALASTAANPPPTATPIRSATRNPRASNEPPSPPPWSPPRPSPPPVRTASPPGPPDPPPASPAPAPAGPGAPRNPAPGAATRAAVTTRGSMEGSGSESGPSGAEGSSTSPAEAARELARSQSDCAAASPAESSDRPAAAWLNAPAACPISAPSSSPRARYASLACPCQTSGPARLRPRPPSPSPIRSSSAAAATRARPAAASPSGSPCGRIGASPSRGPTARRAGGGWWQGRCRAKLGAFPVGTLVATGRRLQGGDQLVDRRRQPLGRGGPARPQRGEGRPGLTVAEGGVHAHQARPELGPYLEQAAGERAGGQ